MHGTLLLSDPGCAVPKFVDDLYRVVQRPKKTQKPKNENKKTNTPPKTKTLNQTTFRFHFYLRDTMFSQLTSQVRCCPNGLDEGLDPPPCLPLSRLKFHHCDELLWANHLPTQNIDISGRTSWILNIDVCIHLLDWFLPWPKARGRVKGGLDHKQVR